MRNVDHAAPVAVKLSSHFDRGTPFLDEATSLPELPWIAPWALLNGEESDFPGDPPYDQALLVDERVTLLRRHTDLHHWRPGKISRPEPEGFDSLLAHIRGEGP